MTFKMIAIVLLALMGLSSVMSPKTFRVLLGGLAALCMAFFFALAFNGSRGDSAGTPMLLAKVQRLLGIQPDWLESSKTILKDIEQGSLGDPTLNDLLPTGTPKPSQAKPPRKLVAISSPIIVRRSKLNAEHQQEIVDGIRDRIGTYLKGYRHQHNHVGVDKLSYKNLDPRRIGRGFKMLDDDTAEVYLLFDERYADYVRVRGKQVVMKSRLRNLVVAITTVGVILLLAFGILKTITRRSPPPTKQDFLHHSDISMV